MSEIENNLTQLQQKVAEAASKAGRKAEDIELLAVSKRQDLHKIREAIEAGQIHFGENRVNELEHKVPALPPQCRWHMIGRLQANKVRKVLPLVESIHSIDSFELAQRVNRIAEELGRFPQVYLQVNIASDLAKQGFTPAQLKEQFSDFFDLDRLEVLGLMTIPSYDPDPELSRIHFANLRELASSLAAEHSIPELRLSMGMSGDYEVAIEEGSHSVRVGTALFGARAK